jgi:hypothetical protein
MVMVMVGRSHRCTKKSSMENRNGSGTNGK